MSTAQHSVRGTIAARAAEISMAVLVGGAIALLSLFLLSEVGAPVAPALIAIPLAVLATIATDIALRSARRRYLS